MAYFKLLSVAFLLSISTPLYAQRDLHAENDYLQNRSLELSRRIDFASKRHQIPAKQAVTLHRSVRQVQIEAKQVQQRNGSIGRADADRMNQNLTDVERTLRHQP